MLGELSKIILFSLLAFALAFIVYPWYIRFLKHVKAGKAIREESVTGTKAEIFQQLHSHKAGTPTMGGGLFLVILIVMIGISYLIKYYGHTTYSLVTRQETYILLFAFFGMGLLGFVDDYMNIKGSGKVKGLGAWVKLFSMFGFAAFVSYRFYVRLGIDYINLWPLAGEVHLGLLAPCITFFLTLSIVNAINITDGLDGLAGGLMIIILGVLAIITFFYNRYLATTVIGIVLAVLMAFLRFNINPARVFMGDAGALSLGGLVSALLYLLNIKMGILIPFMILFAIFRLELLSSFLQIFRKKIFKKKLFTIAPFHHLLEHNGMKETTIVMRFWLLQGILAAVTMLLLFYQMN